MKKLFIVLVLSLLASSAGAQDLLKNLAKKNDINSPANAVAAPGLSGDPITDLHNAIKKGGAQLITHLKIAYAYSISPGSDNQPVDATPAPCYKALVPIVDLVVNGPKSATVPAGDPMALTTDEQAIQSNKGELDGVIVQVEKIRILRLTLTSTALNIACGPLVQDEVKNAQNLIGKVTSLITGAGLLGVAIP